MFAVFLIVWFVLNGRITWEVFGIGMLLCIPVYLFFCVFMDFNLKKELNIYKKIPWAIKYVCILLWEIVKANFAVMHLILSPKLEPEPVLFTFRTELKEDADKVLLANSITLTPGTITVKMSGDRYTVHALDRDIAEGTENSVFVRLLMEQQEAENGTGV